MADDQSSGSHARARKRSAARSKTPKFGAPVVPVVLCGGMGKRLWPLSGRDKPKQFSKHALLADKGNRQNHRHGTRFPEHLTEPGALSLFQQTCLRLEEFEKPVIATASRHLHIVERQLAEIAVAADILAEPHGRDTGLAIAVAAEFIAQKYRDAIMVVLPSDHFVGDEAAFRDAIVNAASAAWHGQLVTFGIRPTHASVQYGYVSCCEGEPVNANSPFASGPLPEGLEEAAHGFSSHKDGCGPGPAESRSGHAVLRPVSRFHEKPDIEKARQLWALGSYWNSGIFIVRPEVLQDEFERYACDIAANARLVVEEITTLSGTVSLTPEAYELSRSISFDKAVMERTRKAVVLAVDFGWADLGSWQALAAGLPADGAANRVSGNVVLEETHGSTAISTGRQIRLAGVSNILVVEDEEGVFVGPNPDPRLLQPATAEDVLHSKMHTRVKPWGSYQVLNRGEDHLVKSLTVLPGGKLSLQRHRYRDEHWVVVSGEGHLLHDDKTLVLTRNDTVRINRGEMHRLENRGNVPLQLIEVQTGSYLEEDDIERLDDDYGRC